MTTERREKIQQLFEELMSMKKIMGSRKDRFLSEHDLTSPQMHILYALAHGKKMTVKDIAEMMGITSSAATQIIEGLVKMNYVERYRDDHDHRIVHIRFSSEGKIMFENFKNAHMEHIAAVFDILTDDELDLIIKIPTKILQNADQICGKKS